MDWAWIPHAGQDIEEETRRSKPASCLESRKAECHPKITTWKLTAVFEDEITTPLSKASLIDLGIESMMLTFGFLD